MTWNECWVQIAGTKMLPEICTPVGAAIHMCIVAISINSVKDKRNVSNIHPEREGDHLFRFGERGSW